MARDFFVFGESMVYLRASLFGEGIFELGMTDEPIRISVNMRHRDIFTDDYGPNIPADVMSTLADATISMNLVHYDENALRLCINHSMGGSSFPNTTLEGAGGFPVVVLGEANPEDDEGNMGGLTITANDIEDEGTLGPAGQPLGAGRDISQTAVGDLPALNKASVNRYITVSIRSAKPLLGMFPGPLGPLLPNNAPQGLVVWRFKSCYLLNHVEIPLSTTRSIMKVTWRAIPYRNPLLVISGAGAGYSLGTSGSLPSSGNVVWDLRSRGVLLYDHSNADIPVLL